MTSPGPTEKRSHANIKKKEGRLRFEGKPFNPPSMAHVCDGISFYKAGMRATKARDGNPRGGGGGLLGGLAVSRGNRSRTVVRHPNQSSVVTPTSKEGSSQNAMPQLKDLFSRIS